MLIEHDDLPVGTAIFKTRVTEQERSEGLFNGEYKWVCISPVPIKDKVFANENYQALLRTALEYYKKHLKNQLP